MRARVVVTIIVLLAAVHVLLAFGLWTVFEREATVKHTSTPSPSPAIQRLGESFASTAFRSLITHDYAALNELIKQSTSWPEVVYVSVEDLQGRILAHTDPQRVGQTWSDALAAETRATAKGSFADVTVLITDPADRTKSTRNGRVRLGYLLDVAQPGPVPAAAGVPLVLAVAALVAIPVGFIVTKLAGSSGDRQVTREIKHLRGRLNEASSDAQRLRNDLSKRTTELTEALDERDRLLAEVQGMHGQLVEHASRGEATAPEPARAVEDVVREADLQHRALPYICHVLRSSLTSVLGFSKLLLREMEGPLNPTQTTAVLSIQRAGSRLLTFVSALGDLVRVESRTLEVKPEAIDIGPLVEEIVGEQELAKSVEVRIEPASDLPLVIADRNHVRQILQTCIQAGATNGPDAVVLSARATDGTLGVQIAHPGASLPVEDIPSFFDPFPPADSPVSTDGGRLRLALARALAVANGGALTVESSRETGVLLTLTLPVLKGAAA